MFVCVCVCIYIYIYAHICPLYVTINYQQTIDLKEFTVAYMLNITINNSVLWMRIGATYGVISFFSRGEFKVRISEKKTSEIKF